MTDQRPADIDTYAARIERCRGCSLCRDEACFDDRAVQWNFGGRVGYRPWVWQVEQCPIGREVVTPNADN